MGYYGLGPGTKVADQLTPLERALRSLPLDVALDALALLEKIVRNIVRQPADEKLRRLRSTNEKLGPLLGHEAGLNLMKEIGWQVDGEFVVLPAAVKLEFQDHIGKIVDARDFYRKEGEQAKLSAKRSRDLAKAEAEKGASSEPLEFRPSVGASTVAPSSKPCASMSMPSVDPRPSTADTEASNSSTGSPTADAQAAAGLTELQDERCGQAAGASASAAQGTPMSMLSHSWCPQGHPLSLAKLKLHQGFIHRRACNRCGRAIERRADRLRCEQCRRSPCAVGRSRDVYSVCWGCASQARPEAKTEGLAAAAQASDEEAEEASQQKLDPGLSASVKALREQRYMQSRGLSAQ
mmetsp:Transcript_1707/g.5332  ORF Transcript_1707/g.5332 Transcript_1707/m.5332 type:complete len:351 (-) Transcript_1707:64-1116(-)